MDEATAHTHDEGAERALLGILLSPGADVTNARRRLQPEDFYHIGYAAIFSAISDLDEDGNPVEVPAVLHLLTARQQVRSIPGGAGGLVSLVGSAPPVSSQSYYTKMVKDVATRRGVAMLALRTQQSAQLTADVSPETLIEELRMGLEDLASDRITSTVPTIGEYLEPAIEEIDQLQRGQSVVGIPTGFHELDKTLTGLKPGQMIVIAARPGMGKALALDTPIATPTGWTTMGEISVGDKVFGRDGKVCNVVAATDVMVNRECYKIEFSDGETIVADAQHSWFTETREDRKARDNYAFKTGVLEEYARTGSQTGSLLVKSPKFTQKTWGSVKTTENIANTLRTSTKLANHSIPVCSSLDLPTVNFETSPYELGLKLGDDNPKSYAGMISKAGQNRVPKQYLRASKIQREEFLKGLVRSGAYTRKDNTLDFVTTYRGLASDVHELAVGLGYRCTINSQNIPGAIKGVKSFIVNFAPEREDAYLKSRYIVNARKVKSVPVRCIQVYSSDHLFLAGKHMIPTHNSAIALDIVRHAVVRHDKSVLFFSLEMSMEELTLRALAAEAFVGVQDMRSVNGIDDHRWQQINAAVTRLHDRNLGIDDNASVTMVDIRAKAREWKRERGLDLVVIDYLQLMQSGRRVESRQQEVSEISRAVKLLAKELQVPVIALSQLNRGSEQRSDKRPVLSDLRESGSIEQDADVVLLLHREDVYERESPRAGEADVIIAKQRSGPTGIITLSWLGKYARFDNRSY